jgi:hypothetical protein
MMMNTQCTNKEHPVGDFTCRDLLFPNVLLVDGLGRSGKKLASKLISHFSRVDYFQHAPMLDHIAVFVRFGHFSEHAAAAFLRLNFDVLNFDRAVGRNLNMRPEDASSILNSGNINEYMQRSIFAEDQAAIDRFKAARRVPCYMTHHILTSGPLFLRALPQLQIIEMERHPIDLVDSWQRRGWGHRCGVDPKAFTPTIDHDETPIAHFATAWADDYVTMTPIDRVVRGVLTLLDLCQRAYGALTSEQRDRVHLIPFEHMIAVPEVTLGKAAAFLDMTFADTMPETLVKERLPTIPQAETRRKKFDRIRSNASPELVEQLGELACQYEQKWGLPPL